jgi:hypothetical protein
MFQFPGFALLTLYIQVKSTWFSRRSSEAILGPFPRARGRIRLLIIEDCQVGFPIRTFRDQRVLSPPPDLSQSATSFIASCCQGIHQTPLSRLIRSRRRQALLREVVQTSTWRPNLVGSLDPSAPASAKGMRRLRVLNGSFSEPDKTHGQCHLTWKDCCRCNQPCGRLRGERPTWRTPEQRLVYNSLHDVMCRMLPSGVSVSRRLVLTIGQEGSSSDEPANQVARPIRSRGLKGSSGRWWSLSGSNR